MKPWGLWGTTRGLWLLNFKGLAEEAPGCPSGSSWSAEVREQQTAFIFEVRMAVLGEKLLISIACLARLRKIGFLVDVVHGFGMGSR